MESVFVIQIKSGSNKDEYLTKFSKGFTTSKRIGLQNLFHNKKAANKEAIRYVNDIISAENNMKDQTTPTSLLEYYEYISKRGKQYEIIPFRLVKDTTEHK